MKEIHFSFGLLDPVLFGRKETTLRRQHENGDLRMGEKVCGVFEHGHRMLLKIKEDTQTKTFANLTDAEAQESGFRDSRDAFEGLQKYTTRVSHQKKCVPS